MGCAFRACIRAPSLRRSRRPRDGGCEPAMRQSASPEEGQNLRDSKYKDSKLGVRSLRVRAVAVPMRLPLQTSTGAVSIAPLVLLDLETTAGITGRAYLFAIGRHNLKPIVALCESMGEMMAGDAVAPFEIEKK